MERIRPAMQQYIDEGKIAGISTLVTRKGTAIHSGHYGMLDKEASKPLRPDSIFRIYSLTRPALIRELFAARYIILLHFLLLYS